MTAHLDLFVQQHLPAQEELPDFINLENFDYPEILNCATPLLDDAVKELSKEALPPDIIPKKLTSKIS